MLNHMELIARRTMKNLETDMGKFTGSAVAASTFVADTCGNVRFVTKKPAKLTTLKVLGKELDKVKACLMDRSAAACATFPDMVYPYAMPMTYHVCLNRGDAAKLTDALYAFAFPCHTQTGRPPHHPHTAGTTSL